MNAECDVCGTNLVYDDNWPQGYCRSCLEAELAQLREERNRYRDALVRLVGRGVISVADSRVNS